MTLFEEFLLRLKIDKHLEAAAECKAKADAGLEKIAAYEAEAAELLKQAEDHLAAIQSSANHNEGTAQ